MCRHVTVTEPTESSAEVSAGSYTPKFRLTAVTEQSLAASAWPPLAQSMEANTA
jgi:hypothetical protein